MLELTTGVMFLVSSLYGSGQSDNHTLINAEKESTKATTTEVRSFTDSKELESYLREEYANMPIMIEIARCESTMKHFGKDGKVIRGRVTPDDIGVMQINQYYHGDSAKRMGIDIYTVEGNVEFAKYLYGKYGSSPWSASASCWSKPSQDLARK